MSQLDMSISIELQWEISKALVSKQGLQREEKLILKLADADISGIWYGVEVMRRRVSQVQF